ncbi:MAG: hypothetical protein ACJ764_10210 [Solirubrobacteraceae bacterium]
MVAGAPQERTDLCRRNDSPCKQRFVKQPLHVPVRQRRRDIEQRARGRGDGKIVQDANVGVGERAAAVELDAVRGRAASDIGNRHVNRPSLTRP